MKYVEKYIQNIGVEETYEANNRDYKGSGSAYTFRLYYAEQILVK